MKTRASKANWKKYFKKELTIWCSFSMLELILELMQCMCEPACMYWKIVPFWRNTHAEWLQFEKKKYFRGKTVDLFESFHWTQEKNEIP